MNSAARLGGRSPGEEVACSPQVGSRQGSSFGLWVWVGFLSDRVLGQEGGWLTMRVCVLGVVGGTRLLVLSSVLMS